MPWERSSWSTQIASSAVHNGADVTRIPASDEEISCSPTPIKRNGPATCTAPSAARIQSFPPNPRRAPRRWASPTRTTAASAIRNQAIAPGERSRSPILMNM
jgi:hypothetical protein